jgi:D-alanyl-D-alanine carboxypeptidase
MRKSILNLLTLIMISFLIIACSKDNTTIEPIQFSAEMQSKLDATLDKAMIENNIPGVIVGIWIPNEGSWVKAKGVSNLATNAPMKLDNHFRMGSITKTFTGTLVLQLADENLINLDSSLAYYLPQYHFQYANKITVRYLGNMRAGIYSYSDDSTWNKTVLANNYETMFTADSLVKISLNHPCIEPGKYYYYCNTNTVLLGLICEKVTGKPINELMQERILLPNGLGNTFWPQTHFLPEPFSHGYTNKTWTGPGEMKDATFFNPSWANAAGILISNIYDLKKWIKLVGTGALYSPAMQSERLKFADNYGFALMNAMGWIGHFGATPGFTSGAFYYPGKDAILIIHVNSNIDNPSTGNSPAEEVGKAFMELLTPSAGLSKFAIR